MSEHSPTYQPPPDKGLDIRYLDDDLLVVDRLAILGIAQADEATRVLCELVFAQGGVGLWNGAGESLLLANIATLNAAETLLPYAQSDLTTIALSGAVGRSVWRAPGHAGHSATRPDRGGGRRHQIVR